MGLGAGIGLGSAGMHDGADGEHDKGTP
jgi:hypothetical protein